MILLVPWVVIVCIFRVRGNTWPWSFIKGSGVCALLFVLLVVWELIAMNRGL